MDRTPAEHRFAASAGDICWFEWGSAAAGKPSLLLLHATGFHARIWDSIVARLPDDWHIITPDLRGHGRSFKPETLYDWSIVAGDVAEMIDAHGWRFDLAVGHSMGGICAGWLAAHRPAALARLLLVDAVYLPPEIYAAAAKLPLPSPADHPVSRRRNQFADAQALIDQIGGKFPYANWDKQVLEDYARFGLLPRSDGSGDELACPPHLEASMYLGSGLGSPYAWTGNVQCPVTVLRGRYGERQGLMDFSISPTWPELAAQFTAGTDMQWDDCSHFIPMEAPDRLAALVMEYLANA